MKILLVHLGYSFPRHFNNLEACVQLLDSVYDVQCDALVCGKAVNACGFRTGKSEWVPDEVVHNWQEPCNSCQQKLLTRLGSFCNSVIGLSDLVSDEDRVLIDSVVAGQPKNIAI